MLLGLPYREVLAIHLATSLGGLVYLAARRSKRLPRLLIGWGLLPLVAGAPIALILEDTAASLPPSTLETLTLTLYTVTLLALLARIAARTKHSKPRMADRLVLGVFEGLAVLPGVSRSGVTAAYLAARGLDPRIVTDAVIASGVVAGGAAGLYELLAHGAAMDPIMFTVTLLASIASAWILSSIGERSATLLSIVIVAGILASMAAHLLLV